MFFQFLKDNNSGERNILSQLDNITLVDGKDNMKFVWNMTDDEKKETAHYYRNKFMEIIYKAQNYDMLVLDEVMAAVQYGFVAVDELCGFLKNKPSGLEVVMTGRNPDERLINISDYVSEIKKIKHPFDHNTGARKMIEF